MDKSVAENSALSIIILLNIGQDGGKWKTVSIYLSIYLSIYRSICIFLPLDKSVCFWKLNIEYIIIFLNMGQDGRQMKKESYLLGLLIFIYLFINILLLVKLDILSVFNNHVGYLFLS